MKTLLILIALSVLSACSSNVKLDNKTAAERQQELLQKRQDARSRN